MNAQTSVLAEDVTFPAIDPDTRTRTAQWRTRQCCLDLLRADIRHRHHRRGRRRDRRGLSGERHDVRQAVYRSRQVDRNADAAVGSRRTPSTSSTTRRNRWPIPDVYIPLGQTGLHRLQHRDRSRHAHHAEGGNGHQHLPSFYFPYAIGGVSWRERIRGKHRQLQLDDDGIRRPAPGRARQHGRPHETAAWKRSSRAIRRHIGTRPTTRSSRRCTRARASSRSRCSTPSIYDTGKQNGRNADFKVVNYMGFFIEEMQGNDVKGRITPIGGIFSRQRRPGTGRCVPDRHRTR